MIPPLFEKIEKTESRTSFIKRVDHTKHSLQFESRWMSVKLICYVKAITF